MRSVRQEQVVTARLDNAGLIYPRIDDQWHALEWTLCRKPEAGIAVKFGYFAYRQQGVGLNNPDIVVLYRYDDEFVTIYEVNFIIQ